MSGVCAEPGAQDDVEGINNGGCGSRKEHSAWHAPVRCDAEDAASGPPPVMTGTDRSVRQCEGNTRSSEAQPAPLKKIHIAGRC